MKWNFKKSEEKIEKSANKKLVGLEENIENSKKWTALAIIVAVVVVAGIAGLLAGLDII